MEGRAESVGEDVYEVTDGREDDHGVVEGVDDVAEEDFDVLEPHG